MSGRMMEHLRTLGLAENTLVIFTSDNGPHNESKHDLERFDPAGPYTGIKRSLTDGGIRVPFIAWWPGKVKPGESAHVGYFPDFMPTAAELAGGSRIRTDGISLVPDADWAKRRRRNTSSFTGNSTKAASSRPRFIKAAGKASAPVVPMLPCSSSISKNDAAEQTNVADKHPDIAAKIGDYLKTARTPLAEWEPQWKAGKKSKK
jgi:arylsulfatase A-like enzyme